MAGSAPAICTEIGSTSPSWFARRSVFSLPHNSEFDATISDTARPAPNFLHSCLKGRSVTPAIGATNRLLRSVCVPIRIDDHGNFFGRERNSIPKPEPQVKRFWRFRQQIPLTRRFFLPAARENGAALLQGSARVPKIMRRARKRRVGANASSAANPAPRAPASSGRGFEKAL